MDHLPEFPPRILDLLRDVADRRGTTSRGPWEDENGRPLQDDAEAALAWIQRVTAKAGRTTSNAPPERLKKAETVALWHAVSNYNLMTRMMMGMDGVTAAQIDAEKGHLNLAKNALKKVNRLRQNGH